MRKGAIFSVSLVMRTAIMLVVVVTIWMTFTPHVDSARATDMTYKMRAIAEHIEGKSLYALGFMAGEGNAAISEGLYLPQLDYFYTASIRCISGKFTVIMSAPSVGRNFIIQENFNCSGFDVSGQVISGYRCLVGDSLGIRLVDYCG
jgi:hypothetical protein